MNENKSTKTLSEKVAEYKLIARNSLRMELISPRLSKIQTLEDTLANIAKTKTEVEHDIKVENYEISKLDKEHPNYDKTKTVKDETVKRYTEDLKTLDKETEEVNKTITEQKEAITKIESGETKVSLEALNDLVEAMVRADAVSKAGDCKTC